MNFELDINGDDCVVQRDDIVERLDFLRAYGSEEDDDEIEILEEFLDGVPESACQLINAECFREYVQKMFADTYLDIDWSDPPFVHIDWDNVVEAIQAGYERIELLPNIIFWYEEE